jgi:uncharacterized protein YggT (Ycf19 family)
MKPQHPKSRRSRATTRWPKWSSIAFYSEVTEPELPGITERIPRSAFLRESWMRRLIRAIGAFFTAIINKINQLLAFALAVLLLLLFTRFILRSFGLSQSQFAYWVFLLSTPLLAPFNNLLPPLSYDGYIIEVSTLVAIVVYALVVTIARQFLKVLVARTG